MPSKNQKYSKIWKLSSQEIQAQLDKNISLTEILKNFGLNRHHLRTFKMRLQSENFKYKHVLGKSSFLWRISKEEWEKLIPESTSISNLLKRVGCVKTSYHSTFKRIVKDLNLDLSKFKPLKLLRPTSWKPAADYLFEGSRIRSAELKKKLLEENIFENKCSECGQEPLHNGKELVLQLDHINGINNDNRLENLRILCPNCHTQTSTYAGKGKGKKKRCIDCNIHVHPKSIRCKKCQSKHKIGKREKIQWPSDEDLIQMIKDSNFLKVGKKLGVSDNAIRKRMKRRNLI